MRALKTQAAASFPSDPESLRAFAKNVSSYAHGARAHKNRNEREYLHAPKSTLCLQYGAHDGETGEGTMSRI